MNNENYFFSKIPREIMAFLETVTEGVEGVVMLAFSLGVFKAIYDAIVLKGEIGFTGRLALFMIGMASLKSAWILVILHMLRRSVFVKKDIAADPNVRIKVIVCNLLAGILGLVQTLQVSSILEFPLAD